MRPDQATPWPLPSSTLPWRGPGERRTITLLFCDVKDSTATAERLDPEEWSAIMRQALDRFITPVERYGGTVVRILGDAILAYFGAPVAHEDDPQRAVLAGLGIVDGCRDLADDVQRRFGIPFAVRVGINTGLVVVGEVGTPLYAEYAALGDAANVAARMEQSAHPGTVLIAEATHRLVGPLFDVQPMGQVQVKGRREPVNAYRVVGPSAAPGSLRGIAGLSSPLVGRRAELDRLLTALTQLRDGRGAVVSVIGEAGLGKSRLVSELAAQARDEVTWIEGGCVSYESTTPYAPFVRALESFFEISADDDPHERYQRLLSKMTELAGDAGARHAAHLATVLRGRIPDEHEAFVRFLEPPVLRQRVFATVAALLEKSSARAPVVLMIEDVHWADRTSIDLMRSLLPLTDRLPLMLLLCLRPDHTQPY
jgi:class 3 adenylate cyclase